MARRPLTARRMTHIHRGLSSPLDRPLVSGRMTHELQGIYPIRQTSGREETINPAIPGGAGTDNLMLGCPAFGETTNLLG